MRTSRLLTATRRNGTVAAIVTVALLLAACGDSSHDGMPDMHHSTSSAGSDHGMGAMPGTDDTPAGDGLSATVAGYRLAPTATALTAGQPSTVRFQIIGPDSKPVGRYAADQTKLMHLYLIRNDLTGFQHVHPTMGDDMTWSAPVTAVQPGTYRMYASFIAIGSDSGNKPLVLGDRLTVSGEPATLPLPAASDTAQVDGYTLTFAGHPTAGTDGVLTVTVTRDGNPVHDLQPYLDTYAHLTAVHDGDLAFAHLHPQGAATGDAGGPTLTFHTTFPKGGNWRLFVQFQTGGVLHTAAVTRAVS